MEAETVMPTCFFASDLHGGEERYRKLFGAVRRELPAAVFLGGDLLPSRGRGCSYASFARDFLLPELAALGQDLGTARPRVLVILGNDDPRTEEDALLEGERCGLCEHLHLRRTTLEGHAVYGYACVPPTPFLLKDWERYDVSRYVDVGGVSPEEGFRSVAVPANDIRYGTIQKDLDELTADQDLNGAILLFHAPPYRTTLDRAGLDGRLVEGVPVDVHVGSVAIQRFIEARQPLITLHGHVHESARLTGSWREQIGRTHAFGAAHDGPELALVRFDPDDPASATRELC
jgi:Icc-related predicted phosphoesterase